MTFYSINPYHVLTAINLGGDLPIAFGVLSIINPIIFHKTKERERINFPNYASHLQAIFARYKSTKILK